MGPADNDSDDSDGETENSDHDSCSEVAADDSDTAEHTGPQYIGKEKATVWNCHPPTRNRRRSKKNIVIHPPGVKTIAQNATTILESWELFFPNLVLAEIVGYTNICLQKMRQNYTRERDVLDTDVNEIKALIGLLYLAGVMKSSHQNMKDLWATDMTAPEYFRLIMSYNRFFLLVCALRFDDIRSRQVRKALDKLAPIRDIFQGFVQRCNDNYSVGEYVTLDEMLESFRGRCSFRQYMPNKPAKYGLKIFALVCSRMFYTVNMEIYAGRQPEGPLLVDNSPTSVVRRMVQPTEKSGRNVTVDNWFSSIAIVNELVKEKNLTMVATLRKNKKEIPPELVNTRSRQANSSFFAFGEHCILVSYVPKKNRNVLLISSMHESSNIDETTGDLMKPEVISFYNLTKGGVDVVDELKSLYTVSRMCRRWPLRIFYTMLDIAGINSQIIFRANTSEILPRRKYLKTLALDLTKFFLEERSAKSGIHSDLRMKILNVLGKKTEPPQVTSSGREKCACPRKKNRKTASRCVKCIAPICGDHIVTICKRCHFECPEQSGSEIE